MTTGRDAVEVQPFELVTVKVCEPAVRPVRVTVAVDPIRLPGLIVQAPAGNPLSTTLPVTTVQDGWVMEPIVGAVGSAATVTAVTTDCAL